MREAKHEQHLRADAEDRLRTTRGDVAALSSAGAQHLVYELQVHQIELEMQNDELQRATRELEHSRAQYIDLYDSAPLGYLGVDASGVIRRANLAAGKLLGLDRERLVGRSLAQLVAARHRTILRDHFAAATVGSTSVCEVIIDRSDREPVWARLETNGEPSAGVSYRTVLTDISPRKRSEEALQRLNQELEARIAARTDELARRNRELEAEIERRVRSENEARRLEARVQDAERFERLGLIANGLAHHFNNLLVDVVSNADLLLENPRNSGESQEAIELIKLAGISAGAVTRQMLLCAGQGQMVLERIGLADTVAAAVAPLRARLHPGIELQVACAPDMPPIKADRGQVQQVVNHLALNAIEAIGDGSGRIDVSTRVEEMDSATLDLYTHRNEVPPGRFGILAVTDNGPGMDRSTLDRIFEPFYSTNLAGRGLGLTAVLGIVRGHAAALRVRSARGQGTTFEVAWRLADWLVSQPIALGLARPTSPRSWRGQGRALLVDDEPSVRGALARQLRRLGFAVTEVGDGAQGLALFQAASPPFRLAVVDQIMPGMSGGQLIAALRALAPTLPVVLVSGGLSSVLLDDRATFLQKPMTTDELQEAVHRVFEASGAALRPSER